MLPPLDEHDRSLIAQLLSHFKQTAEVRQYMKYYGTVVGHRFAVVKVSGDVVSGDAGLADAETERVASSLAFLRRSLEREEGIPSSIGTVANTPLLTHTVAQTLLQWLYELPEPLLGCEHYEVRGGPFASPV